MKRPSKRAEKRALDELSKHSYLFFKLTGDDRYTSIFHSNRKTGRMSIRNAVAIKLVVPMDSVLGRQIVRLYNDDERKARKKA